MSRRSFAGAARRPSPHGALASGALLVYRIAVMTARAPILLLGLALAGCAAEAHHAQHPHHAAPAEGELAEIASIHGGAGPWVVAGYRMGRHALARLGLEKQSFDLEVAHHTPRAVQFSCMADGAAAATGASLGKLNLTLVEADAANVETTYRRKSTGASITLRPTAAFRARFLDVPRERLAEAGRTVLGLPDAEIFEEAPRR